MSDNNTKRTRIKTSDSPDAPRPKNRSKDSVRCPVCVQKISILRDKDIDEQIKNKLQKCAGSNNMDCSVVLRNPKNREILNQILNR